MDGWGRFRFQGHPDTLWEHSFYLNLILHLFEYTLTCAVCSRTSAKELQILRKVSHKVYATPSRRRMDSKGTREEITYPNVFFTVDNFEELYRDMVVKDSELVVVELVASDSEGNVQGTLFMGSIRYDALRRVFDSRASLSNRLSRNFNAALFSNTAQRVEFVRMRGPDGKGYAEMAVSKHRETGDMSHSTTFDDAAWGGGGGGGGSGGNYSTLPNHRRTSSSSGGGLRSYFTPGHSPNSSARGDSGSSGGSWWTFGASRKTQTPAAGAAANQRSAPKDPMTASQYAGEAGYAPSGGLRKSQSEVENVDRIGNDVYADHLRDELDQSSGTFGLGSQALHWFKEKKRANCVGLNAFLTYVSLPWQRIIADVIEVRQQPTLTF